ncbi:MAG: cache domain-containing protein [Pseudomonadota bacterium]
MSWNRTLRLLTLLVLGLLSLASTIWQFVEYHRDHQAVIGGTVAALRARTKEAAVSVDKFAREVEATADGIARGLSDGTITHAQAVELLRTAVEAEPDYYGGGVFYAPHSPAFPDQGYHGDYFDRGRGAVQYSLVEEDYGEEEWYRRPLAGEAAWVEPYVCPYGQTVMITYATPIRAGGGTGEPVGTVTIDLSVDELRAIMVELDLGEGGFPALVSRAGTYLYHPNSAFAARRETLRSTSASHSDQDRLTLAERGCTSSIIEHTSTTTGEASFLATECVGATQWSLPATFLKADLDFDTRAERHQLMRTTVGGLLSLLVASVLASGAWSGRGAVSRRRLWLLSVSSSVLLALAILSTWLIVLQTGRGVTGGGHNASTPSSLAKIERDLSERSAQSFAEPPRFIPTGLLVESMRFDGTERILLTGQIWQKLPPGSLAAVPAFSIPGAEGLQVEAVHRVETEAGVLARWHFQCGIALRMDPDKYPLNEGVLELALIHPDTDHNVVLVPDLESNAIFSSIPRTLLAQDVQLPGWRFTRVHTELRPIKRLTSMGTRRSIREATPQSLVYSVPVHRLFLNSFISHLTPLIVVALLLFIMLAITTNHEKLKDKLNPGVATTLSLSAGLFFTVVFSHIGVRQKIAAESIFYLEYFYLVMYLMLLFVPVNSIMVNVANPLYFFRHRSNLLPKLIFWPLLLGLLLGITLYVFY